MRLASILTILLLASCGGPTEKQDPGGGAARTTGDQDLSTPDGLARVLLAAMQNDEPATWVALTHPESTFKPSIEKDFRLKRDKLTRLGLTDWSQVRYDLVKYNYDAYMGQAPADVATFPVIEFSYGEGRFMGSLWLGAFKKQGDRYLLWSTNGSAAGFGRMPAMPGS